MKKKFKRVWKLTQTLERSEDCGVQRAWSFIFSVPCCCKEQNQWNANQLEASKFAVSSKMILLSLGHDGLRLWVTVRRRAHPSVSQGRFTTCCDRAQRCAQPFCTAAINYDGDLLKLRLPSRVAIYHTHKSTHMHMYFFFTPGSTLENEDLRVWKQWRDKIN